MIACPLVLYGPEHWLQGCHAGLLQHQDLGASKGISSALNSIMRQFSGLDTEACDMEVSLTSLSFNILRTPGQYVGHYLVLTYTVQPTCSRCQFAQTWWPSTQQASLCQARLYHSDAFFLAASRQDRTESPMWH